jgi:hypothetical protein
VPMPLRAWLGPFFDIALFLLKGGALLRVLYIV